MDQMRDKIEQGILQCLLLNQEFFNKSTLMPEDFENLSARRVYAQMHENKRNGLMPCDFLTLSTTVSPDLFEWFQLMTDGRFEGVVMPNEIEAYVTRLREFASQKIVERVIRDNRADMNDPFLIKSLIDAEIKKTMPSSFEAIGVTLKKIFNKYFALFESKTGMLGISTGFQRLDSYTAGFNPSEIYIIAARPSMGKSAFALNLALNMARNSKRVYWQALEESKEAILKRLTANLTGIDLARIIRANFEGDEWNEILNIHSDIEKLPLIIDEDSGLSSAKICERIMRQHNRAPLDCVIIDHLQEIIESKGQNRHLEISHALSNFRALSKDLKIPVIILSQINRNVESRKSQLPVLSDLKESGDIEAKADCVMLLYRDKYYNKENVNDFLDVRIAKNRNGECGGVQFEFNGGMMRVKEN